MPEFIKPLAVKLMWLVIVVIFDLALGIIAAIKKGEFEWVDIADILRDFGEKVVAWLALEALDMLPDEFRFFGNIGGVLGTGAFGLILASYVASIIKHVQDLGLLPSLPRFGLPKTSRKSLRR